MHRSGVISWNMHDYTCRKLFSISYFQMIKEIKIEGSQEVMFWGIEGNLDIDGNQDLLSLM